MGLRQSRNALLTSAIRVQSVLFPPGFQWGKRTESREPRGPGPVVSLVFPLLVAELVPATETLAAQARNTGKVSGSVFVSVHPTLTQAESCHPVSGCGILPAHSLLKK